MGQRRKNSLYESSLYFKKTKLFKLRLIKGKDGMLDKIIY